MLNFEAIPQSLRGRRQWVLWRTVVRNGLGTKLPFTKEGRPAKSNDSDTWCSYSDAVAAHGSGRFDGIGFVFSDSDPFIGVDLDGCRHKDSGELEQWAKEIIADLATYAEVSPSQTGVKLIAIGKLPFRTGGNQKLPDMPVICEKLPGIEAYDHARFWTITGWRIDETRPTPEERNVQIAALCSRYFPHKMRVTVQSDASSFYAPTAVVDRARKYLMKCPPAISGNGGHKATFRTACILVHGFMLERDQALSLLQEWNQICQPPWTDKELEHKINGAVKADADRRGYLRHAQPEKWATVSVPDYSEPKHREVISLADAAKKHLSRLRAGDESLIKTGMEALDVAIGGGVEPGEMVILAGRPGHCKSAVALQCVHNWTAAGLPVLFVSEEMSAVALGKRALLFASDIDPDVWRDSTTELESDLDKFTANRAPCYIVQNCGTASNAVEEIERAVIEHDIKCAVIDYTQLLSSPGGGRYEQITNTSIALRRVASEQGIVVLALCQLNRDIESRLTFTPRPSDLRETGQLEQDADVIIFVVWPHRIDQGQDQNLFKFYVAKNRNRATEQSMVQCRFDPNRQMVIDAMPAEPFSRTLANNEEDREPLTRSN